MSILGVFVRLEATWVGSTDAFREDEELCFTFKNKRLLKDSLKITSKARVPWRKTVAGQRSGSNSLMGEPNLGSWCPHESRDDSRANSSRLDAELMVATNQKHWPSGLEKGGSW